MYFFIFIVLLQGCAPNSTSVFTTEDLRTSTSFWDSNVVYWFSLALDTFSTWCGGKYGIAVLIMVLLVRTLILPLTIKQMENSKAMQAIQPQLKQIREKYKDDPQKVQEEFQKLSQENNVNPLAGCLPTLVQLPILIALYSSISCNSNLKTDYFLWSELGKPDPLFILPFIAAVTMFIQTSMMLKMNSSQQVGPMKVMMWITPIVTFVIGVQFPAALSLYLCYTNIYIIVQNYFFYKNNSTVIPQVSVSSTASTYNKTKKAQKGKGKRR